MQNVFICPLPFILTVNLYKSFIISLLLQNEKPALREYVQGCTSGNGSSQDSGPGSLLLEPVLLVTELCCFLTSQMARSMVSPQNEGGVLIKELPEISFATLTM